MNKGRIKESGLWSRLLTLVFAKLIDLLKLYVTIFKLYTLNYQLIEIVVGLVVPLRG